MTRDAVVPVPRPAVGLVAARAVLLDYLAQPDVERAERVGASVTSRIRAAPQSQLGRLLFVRVVAGAAARVVRIEERVVARP